MTHAFTGYRCSDCGAVFAEGETLYLCLSCGRSGIKDEPLRGVLEAQFDWGSVSSHLRAHPGEHGILLPVDASCFPPYPVGGTPLVRGARLEASLRNNPEIHLKLDGQNPSGSLKDRASFLVVAQAIRDGFDEIVTASTGNAASALAACAASAGKTAVVYVPAHAPRAKLAQMRLHGAVVHLVDGTYDDAFAASLAHTQCGRGLSRNTAYNPLTIEGKKTVAFELFEELGRAPDAVVVPVGDGVILSAVHKGFKDLRAAGLISTLPRLVAAQAQTSNTIATYFETGQFVPARNPSTVADSISVRVPAAAHLARRALVESKGLAILSTDEEILAAQVLLARLTGIFAEPAAACAIAALEKATSQLEPSSLVVVLLTGHGLKDIDAALRAASLAESSHG
ncbi:MAG: threonine synthase [Myxococcota bacterium]|jgi:threonine synthase|nr:threonine synthase [Myxococcota bacterium]